MFDRKSRTNASGQPAILFSNQIVREKTSGFSNTRNGVYSSTPKPAKKISSIDLNCNYLCKIENLLINIYFPLLQLHQRDNSESRRLIKI